MTILLPFLLSTLTGYLLILALCKGEPVFNKTLTMVLALGLGTGINAVLTFYSFLAFNRFHPDGVRAVPLAVALLLLVINAGSLLKRKKSPPVKFSALSAALIIGGLALIVAAAKTHPYGDRGAWLVYNMKMKFLVHHPDGLDIILTRLHPLTRPAEPLLLPFIHVYHAAFSQTALTVIPFFTGIIFAFLPGRLMFAGLKQVMPELPAFTAAGLLLTNPFYLKHATAQQADTLLAFYLLAAVICVKQTLILKHKGLACLSGLFLGLMTFAADEGVIMALSLLVSVRVYLFCKTTDRKEWQSLAPGLLLGFLITASAAIIFKFFLAPGGMNFQGGLTAAAFFSELGRRHWTFIWYFIFALMLLANRRLIYKECKTFVFFLIVFLSMMMINTKLSGSSAGTFSNIGFDLLPSVLFFVYYALYRKQNEINATP